MDIVSGGAAIYTVTSTGVNAAYNLFSSSGKYEVSNVSNRYYDPLLTLFELAMIPLEDHNYRHNMRLYFDKVITRCPNTTWNQATRTISRVKSVPYKRTQTKALVRVVIRALDWYDVGQDDKFSRSVRFLFEKAIEGLEIYQETYSQGIDPNTQKTLRYIGNSIKYLRFALEEKESEEAADKIKKQKEREKKEEIEFVDSRDFWVYTSTESDEVYELLSTKVEELKQLYQMKETKKMDHSNKIKETYEVQKINLDKYLKQRQQQFVKNYLTKKAF